MILNYFNVHVLYPVAEKYLGRNIRSKLRVLQEDSECSREIRTKRRQLQLHHVLTTAQNKVPYYRDLFKKIEFYPDSILKDIQYLQELPYLTKEIVQEQGERLLNTDANPSALHVRKTGGSTGISTLIYYDQESLDWTAAANLYAQSFTGRNQTDLEVHLSTEFFLQQSRKTRWIEQVKCWAMNRRNILTHSFTSKALDEIWKNLRSIRPYLIQGHPSTLYALAKHIETNGPKDLKVIRVFESTGESMDQKKCTAIEEHIGCKAYNRYGTAEFGVTAHSRDNPDELEILDYIVHHETVALGNGLEEIVGTTTTNIAMPLIRYRSGDIGRIEQRGEGDYITHLQGRVHDLVEINGSPYPTHYLQDVLDRVGGVSEFQIVIRPSGKRVLNVVLDQLDKQDAIVNRVKELFGEEDIPVKFVKLENLVRIGWRDKFRYVVKEV
ncbi:MAG: phenylacetate--CoA ligase family protein [Bdellovibrionales bacterium]|nr:phenylacetate--CoA ligase family protein [Bdellovibrionales bacterium]